MTDCPCAAQTFHYSTGHLLCHLGDGHTGKHWDRYTRAWWSVEITYDTADDGVPSG